ncbi:MAG: PEGA domain-containing protein [Methanoregula sp.]|nr:PEGA domain-containing protein [Methanoregula sp.]
MLTHHPIIASCILALACLLLIPSVSAAPGIQASFGDIIPLSGYSYSSQTVYLYVTGPNLPVNGVALNDISKRAEDGGFTQVQVDSNDHWSYKWGTGSIGGRLDEGTYTIWVVNGPNDRSHLSQADYSTISVTLKKPSISINTPLQSGSMDLRSIPDGASVVMGEKYLGKTPMKVSDLSPGTYDVIFSQFGYQKFSTRVPVEAGRISEVSATLVPDTGALAITSVPAGGIVLVDGKNSGIAPVTIGNLTMGNHTVAVSLDGYMPLQQTLMVVPGQTLTATIGLSPALMQKTVTTHTAEFKVVTLIAGFVAIMLLIQYVRRR